MSFREIPAPGYTKIDGTRPPRDPTAQWHIQLRNGFCDEQHSYVANQIIWKHDGSSGDVVAVKPKK